MTSNVSPQPEDAVAEPVRECFRVTVRPKGRLSRIRGEMVDFNRHGAALKLPQPVDKDKQVFLTFEYEGHRLDNLVGVVHNCVSQEHDFRVGIQFRTRSELQFDRESVERVLCSLEDTMHAAGQLT